MEFLIICSGCGHGGIGHDGSGCATCACRLTKEDVIEHAIDAAREEIRALWMPENRRELPEG